jgi:hypothetical protein
VFSRFQGAVSKYLKTRVRYLGYIGDDQNLKTAVCEQRPVLLHRPNTHASRCFKVLADVVKKQFSQAGQHHGFSEYWRMLSVIQTPVTPTVASGSTAGRDVQAHADAGQGPSAAAAQAWLKDKTTTQEQAAQYLQTVVGEYIKRWKRLPYKPEKYLSWLVDNKHYTEAETRELLRALEASFVQRYQQPVYDLETMLMQWLDGMGLPVEVSRMMKDRIRQTA